VFFTAKKKTCFILARRIAYRCKGEPARSGWMRPNTMIRQLSILTVVILLVGGVQSGHAQSRPSPPSS
jgi:hypothetical protein